MSKAGEEVFFNRGRVIGCSGCPTITCTCFTPLELDLLNKLNDLIKATGRPTIRHALAWARSQRRKRKLK